MNVIFKSRGQLAESKYLIPFRFTLYYLYTTFEVRNVGCMLAVYIGGA
ncbi:hypothetical protein CKA32_000286 [Geitlerinema sp. FC II]|nr:hypothetical protein CKA32_000286 [Geitlerinema sp. FC II]